MVVKRHREYCWVRLDAEAGAAPSVVIAKPRGRLEQEARTAQRRAREAGELERITAQQLAPGDRVRLSPPPDAGQDAHWTLEAALERETWLIRKSEGRYSRKAQLVVANADQLAVVVAPNPEIRLGTVDRYFLAAMQGGLEPLLVVNKLDIAPDLAGRPEITNYRDLGYRVFFTDARHGAGVEALRPALAGRLTAFCGHSGVGKSTLLSRLTGLELKAGAVRERDQKGRQTTVTAEAYPLPGGGDVVDTPGVREFGLAHLTWLDVHEYFSDIANLTLRCAFADCTHTVEPGCAVLAAVAAGRLAAGRVESYRRLRAEAEAAARDYRA
jgi:ribosome biogenesis GTPase